MLSEFVFSNSAIRIVASMCVILVEADRWKLYLVSIGARCKFQISYRSIYNIAIIYCVPYYILTYLIVV